ncbi:hypothetical protein CDL15_Pgr011785 [Punica granatum]|uniref:Uncharacterized protein n=1 Tax=Punica granatum TaxID=22663 RepID=A0A218XDT5_PUNGR|nr:hypothetical protein CDL15_Pgr011785 [Punica granatum]
MNQGREAAQGKTLEEKINNEPNSINKGSELASTSNHGASILMGHPISTRRLSCLGYIDFTFGAAGNESAHGAERVLYATSKYGVLPITISILDGTPINQSLYIIYSKLVTLLISNRAKYGALCSKLRPRTKLGWCNKFSPFNNLNLRLQLSLRFRLSFGMHYHHQLSPQWAMLSQ